mmetsp:Transcript_31360/g.35673  ORF Transcript_31360/g.35673 Transcript_31360/m.35673 type:complete len:629 (-) Transcript_31360:138-2024(-)|eukprot:CAMPEP_0194159270 /NCGR_PEP_ID=MMETSP0152-20130528/77733_1 /TAXON_ID=1049557 /ORGANISM="Thalassiothrix antarctica, Strain L6-D1" /LENGTH=628 /DNA_ID=CAMNT_0038868813 /DNA_START=138 /DNA_END=2024 /DNA_ORIENTATION=+
MSGARKLQTEIDRVMKKVDEGVELFDEIWEKVYAAEQQNQKEKYELDLKKEIKKLQRLRDQIKTWIGSSDVKDKDALVDARKLIETKMEQFKICEKETKTKTYSKEGLARAERLDPTEQAKIDTTTWIGEYIDQLNQLVEDRDVEIERLSTGKGKKTNKIQIEELNHFISQHRFHINKLEGIMRLVNNDRLGVEVVDPIKEDLDYYLEAHEDDDYQQAYDEEFFYETLGLDELDVVNVDRVTQLPQKEKAKEKLDEVVPNPKSSKSKKEKKFGPTVIPLKIGRAQAKDKLKEQEEKEKNIITPSKIGRTGSSGSSGSLTLGPTPARAPPPPAIGGTSMAAILKREQQDQEKERQAKAQQQQQEQQRQQAEIQRQSQLQRQQQEQMRQEELQRQQAQQKVQEQMQQEQLLQEQLQRHQAAQKEAAQKKQQLQSKKVAEQNVQQQQQVEGMEINYGLGGLSLGTIDSSGDSGSSSAVNTQAGNGASFDSGYLNAINESYNHMPTGSDSERQRQYAPRNPYPVPSSYPSDVLPIFENPAVFGKLGTDCLFFIFYYKQGTYQQYLAARELKKQSWRYHKKYMTWFQRHEEPKVTTDEYEQGTYVYFDWETGWCQRIKQDFRFEYSFLEDSLQ